MTAAIMSMEARAIGLSWSTFGDLTSAQIILLSEMLKFSKKIYFFSKHNFCEGK
jgi:hypothetical protein